MEQIQSFDFARTGRKRKIVWLFVYLALSALTSILCVLCLHNTQNIFIFKNRVLFSVIAGGLCIVAYLFSVWITLHGREIWQKTLLSAYVLIIFLLVIWLVLQITGFFILIKNQEALEEYLQGAGRWMPFVYVALQFLQVVLLPIPGIMSTLAGIALFGAIPTAIYSLIGIVTGSITAFLIGRKLGYKAVSWLLGKESLQKWQKKLKGRDNLFLTLAFLLPVFPDDILCFVSGLSSMSVRYFCIMIFISRLLAISATCFSFDFIPFNTWWGLLVWTVLLLLLVFAFVFIYKNFDALHEKLSKCFNAYKKKRNIHSKNKSKKQT